MNTSSNTPPAHLWITGATRRDRAAKLRDALRPADDGQAPDVLAVCSHRRLRGPYGGTAELLTRIVPAVQSADPGLVKAHDIELLSVAPAVEHAVQPSRETLTSVAIPEERTRFYGPGRTRRLAHGVVEFLNAYAASHAPHLVTVSFDAVHEADATEQELLAILLRRADPARLRVVIGTDGAELPERAAELGRALRRYAVHLAAPARPAFEDDRTPGELARAFVESDGTSESLAQKAAYDAAEPGVRAALHDARAAVLELADATEFRLGALPYHRALGTDPGGAGLRALIDAAGRCVDMGYYHAVLELGGRARELADPERQEEQYCVISTRLTSALAVLGQADRAGEIYFDLRSRYTTPMVHLFSNYALGMLHTRHRAPQQRDHPTARVHLHTAIALASLMPEASRSFQRVFQQNGLALVEMHLGNLDRAEQLVSEGLAELDAELAEGEHLLHRSVLLHNRGQVRAALGRLEEGLADFTAVIAADPNHPEYYFDRAALYRRMDRHAEAAADYQRAIDVSPPFPEAHYNRGDLRAATGDPEGAIADFGYVLELEPDHLDARINRAALLLENGDPAGARADAEEGLAHHPDSAGLLCTRGLAALEEGDADAALRDFSAALDLDPGLYQALANRAVIALDRGRHQDALDDLDRALDLTGPDPALLYNRGYVHRAAGRLRQAEADFTAALGLPGADRAELLWERAKCRAQAGDAAGQRADLEECVRLGDSEYADRASRQLAGTDRL
ncbi:tetratricopeptide repeat protein [Streptomyces sp. NPDC002676]